jgi:non-specific protein-tyrosine kinase
VVEPARVPTVPVRPKTVQNTLLAAVVGMMLGVGLVFLIEYLDDSIRSPEQITGLLRVPVIGVIARMNGGSHNENGNRSLIAVKQPRSPVVEAFRALRTNIQFTSVDRPVRSLLVTSAVPVEGKSTVSANLAVVMAQAGLRVLLVDCDLRRPSVHKLFDQTNRVGLTDMMLQASAQWDSAAQPTQTANLSILSSGSLPPNPAELLGSERLRQLLDRLRSNYDMVILDSPPMLPITDATVLARVVDGVLLVVDTGVTRVGAVLQSKELLERVGGRLIGVVMNKVAKGVGGYSHYYHYYDQYDYGGGKHPSSARSKNGGQKMAEAGKAQAEETAAGSERV